MPVVASLHTRFETYFRYYGAGIIEPTLIKTVRVFPGKCIEISWKIREFGSAV